MFRIVVGSALRATSAKICTRQLVVAKKPLALAEASKTLPRIYLAHQHQPGHCRHFSAKASDDEGEGENDENEDKTKTKSLKKHESRDRRIPIDVATSIEYMKSEAFKATYKDFKIWQLFRRNFPGQFSPAKPRLRCIEDGFVKSSNPCVICRDRYLVLDYTNIDLLSHFVSGDTGYAYPNTVICLCMEQYEKLCVAITLAKRHGLIDFEVPQRQYKYDHYYPQLPARFVE